MEAFEAFEHAGFTIELHQDEDAGSPAQWDQLGTLVSFESRNALEGFEDCPGDVFEARERERPGLTVRFLRARGEYAVLFRIQDYGSGNVRLRPLADGEDERATGYIFTTRERFELLCGAWGYKPAGFAGTAEEWLPHTLRSELESWDAWLEGRVVGYVVSDSAGEVVESCWGFYPDDSRDGLEDVRAEARSAAEGERDERARRELERRQGWAIARMQSFSAGAF